LGVIRRDDGNYTTITPRAAAPALRQARVDAAREYRRRHEVYTQQRSEYLRSRAENLRDLPDLEEVNGSPDLRRRPPSDPSFQLCSAEGMSDQARAIVKSALAEPGSFSHIKLNCLNGSEFWDLLLSLVVHQVAAAAEVERTSEALGLHGNILTSPLQELINVITREHRARPYFLKLQAASIVSLNPMNMAPFELQALIGNKRVQALLGRTPPVEVIFQSIEMTVRRFFPDDHERIMVQMQNAQLSPKEHMKLVKNKGELAVWVLTKSGLQGVRQYSPQIFDLSSIQEQVDEEEYARIEEMSMGASITSMYHFDSEPQTTEHLENETHQEMEGVAMGQDVEGAEGDQIYEDLDPLDPMGSILSRALRLSRTVVASKSKLLNQYMLTSFDTVEYVHEQVLQDVSPAVEFGYPLHEIDFHYAGVQDIEAVKILMAKVVTPWVEKYYPDAIQVVKLFIAKKSLDELIQLCQAPFQLGKEVETLKLILCTPKAEAGEDKQCRDQDPVVALPKDQSECIIQVELSSSVDPHEFLGTIEDFLRELEPEHEGTVVDAWVLNKDLSESKLSGSQDQTIRIRVQASFNFHDFFAIERDASDFKKKYCEIVKVAGGNGKILTVVPSSYKMAAWLPYITPDESMEKFRMLIRSLKNSMVQEGTYEIDWDENYSFGTSVRMIQVKADPAAIPHLKKILEENSPIQCAGKIFHPILQGEDVDSPFYRDVLDEHDRYVNRRRLLRVDEIPKWFKPDKAVVTEAIYGSVIPQDREQWTVSDLLLHLSPSGISEAWQDRVFIQVLPGNTANSMSIVYDETKRAEALSLREEILRIVTAAIGEESASHLIIESYPEAGGVLLRGAVGEEPLAQDGNESIDSEESIEPHLRKPPPEQMEIEQRMGRLEEVAKNLETLIAKVGTLDLKLDRFSVSLTYR
jgi:hypothetical protein